MSDSDKTAGTESKPPASLGQTLQNARLAQDLTIEQVAAELRIEVKQLKALEEDRFTAIGVPVFVKGYLKQYGQRLGLDTRDLLVAYYRQTNLADVQIQPSRTIKLRDERQITSWLLAGIVLLAVVVGLAVWWWSGGTLELTRASAGATASPATEQVAPATDAAAPLVSPPAERAVEAETAPPPAALSETVAEETPDAPVDEVAPPGTAVSLVFTFDAESWAGVTDGRGERLLFGLHSPGQQAAVSGQPPFEIVLGNANAVRLLVNGQDYPIPTRGRQGDRVAFTLDVAEE
jgi:cytoskeleton protein RodZ